MSKRDAVPTNPIEEKVIECVSAGEWFVALIPPEHGAPPWAFTVGLWENFKQPEVVIVGLPPQVMHAMLNTAGQIAMTGRLEPGLRTDELLSPAGGQSLSCELRPVDKFWYAALLGIATWYYEGEDFPALQCLWPDRTGKLPFDEGFDPKLLAIQPDLATSDYKAARMGAIIHSLRQG
jgi:hypothetical protein